MRTPDDQPPPGPLSAARTAALAGGLVALLAVVSLAAGSGERDRGVPGSELAGSLGHHAFAWFLLVVVPIVAVVGLLVFFYSQVVRRRDPVLVAARRRARRRFVVASVLALAILGYYVRNGGLPFGGLRFRNPFANGAQQDPSGRHPLRPEHSGGFSTVDWVVAGATWLLIAAALILAVRQLRRRPQEPEAVVPAEDADEPADTRLARLRVEADPRRAVIGAYALMDRLMADRDLGRQRSEAPLEYLGRMTAAGYARITALGRLTRLYARARFSTHPIDRTMQAEAVDAVEAIATEGGE